MRFIVGGGGAIGSTTAGYLKASGEDVVLIGKASHVAAIQKRGLSLRTAKGEIRTSLQAITDVEQLSWSGDDVLFLATKSQDTPALLASLSSAPASMPVFCFQNGVRNEELAAKHFSDVYGVLVLYSANFIEPGVVEHTRNDQLTIGRYPTGLDDRARQVGQAMTRAGFRVTYDPNVMAHKWGKLLVNLCNAVYALVDTWLQFAYTDPQMRHFFAEVMNEGLDILKACDIDTAMGPGEPTPEEFIQKLSDGEFGYPEPNLPPDRRTYPSTWQDVRLGRKSTEVEHFNGEIVRLAKECGRTAPRNSVLLECMRELSAKGAMPGLFTLREIEERIEAHDR